VLDLANLLDNIRDMKKTTSPTLQLEITKENYQNAVKASSGACLVADAIKRQYPQFSHVYVDVATTRITDKERGERYVYLTPSSAGEYLLAFDQGWPEEFFPKKIRFRNPIKILPITKSVSMVKKTVEQRAARRTELEDKEQLGFLTRSEKSALTRLRNPKPAPERPVAYGPAQVEGTGPEIVIRGGRERPLRNRLHANLLHGKTRHFGAKTAQPSEVFKRAVKEAVKADRAKRRKKA